MAILLGIVSEPVPFPHQQLKEEMSRTTIKNGSTIAEALSPTTLNEERGLVLYRAPDTELSLSFKMDPKLINGLKNHTFWPRISNTTTVEKEFREEQRSSSNCLAVVPWVPSVTPSIGPVAEMSVPRDEPVEPMEADDTTIACMEIEDDRESADNVPRGLSRAFPQPQQCMIPQLLQRNTTAVNVLMHTAEVLPTEEQKSAIERFQRIHREQDEKEMLNSTSSKEGVDPSSKERVHDCFCEAGNELNYLLDQNQDGGALWDIFRREDVEILKTYLRTHLKEFRHTFCSPVEQVFNPVHDEVFYLTQEHKKKLKQEFGIEPWTFVQRLGEAVFIPAGCPHQVRNLKSCTKVALDFVSPENVNQCISLTEDFRLLPLNHRAKEDKLEIKKMIIYAVNSAVTALQSVEDSKHHSTT
ncbi:hypothetical protein HPP92_026235 [Vanilla planifolia]|uniref:JmjC domain-containing protein n=1 Tax=Vanilla planifolia TaxID=51239 RepID=A0A835PCZ5_VANPL|nr:hypothetical protein HPP92_026235 [Vanilla planifolia]